MNPINANFMELYRRHLCRHSEFGINILHLIAVVGVYFSLYGIAFSIPGGRWIVAGVLSIYFAVIAKNVPFPLWIANTTVVLLILGIFSSNADLARARACRLAVCVASLPKLESQALPQRTSDGRVQRKVPKGSKAFLFVVGL